MPDLTESMKRAALQAMEASKPVSVAFGTVVQEAPLLIAIEEKMTLGTDQLILCRHVTDHEIDVTVEWASESALGAHRHSVASNATTSGGDPAHSHDVPASSTGYANLAHGHGIRGRKSMRVHLGLTLGERVVLLRLRGGQQYLVWDRVG